ncbi:MAG: ABC transporter ATP-binding protein [Rhizobiales bacterium]|nr:ABC transporter ATP-binding protein [Hyphomicrobiales bacterium]
MREPLDNPLPISSQGATSLVRRLVSDYGRAYWRRYALAFALMAVSAACTALTAYLIGQVINAAYVSRSMHGIVVLCISVIAIFAAKGVATYGHAVILARIGNRIIADNQRRMYSKLLSESLSFFADRHSSEFMSRLNTGAIAASQVLNLLTTAIGRDLLSLIGLVAVMVVQDPLLSLVALVVLPPAMFVLRKLIRRARTVAYNQFVGGTRVLESLQETLQGIRTVKAFTLEDEMQRRVDENIAAVERASNQMARVANRSSPLMETLGGLAIGLVILYSGYRVIVTNAAPGEFFSFITAFLLAYEPGKRLARLNIDLNSALVGVRVLFDLIDSPSSEPDEKGRPPLVLKDAKIEFDRVGFFYRTDEAVLRDMTFVAEPGQVTALVGPSGGGKSTVLNLILRFYDPSSGRVLIDGQDIASTDRQSLRRQIAYVGQDIFLFRGTIRENIAFGRLGASDAEIQAAAAAAFAHDFIMRFPNGYDTQVGEHGLQLSGGQRQRIAIARALVKDAPIILLDEATAALDSESEQEVQRAIARLCEGRTTLVIAHRLSTIMHADCIHVIENGRITESGRHDALLRQNGRYAFFYRLQLQESRSNPAAQAVPAPAK